MAKEVPRLLHADGGDFLLDGPPQLFAERPLHDRVREPRVAEYVRRGDAVADVLPDEGQRVREPVGLEGADVGRAALDDAFRLDEEDGRSLADGWVRHHRVEDACRGAAGRLGVGVDARDPWRGEVADEVVVVDAEDRDLGGDSDAEFAAGAEDLVRADVVAAEDGDGLREGAEPGLEGARVGRGDDAFARDDHVLEPADDAAGRAEVGAGVVRLREELREARAAGVGKPGSVVAAEGEVREAAVEEVPRGELGDRGVVDLDGGEGGMGPLVEGVDDGSAETLEERGGLGPDDAEDEAVEPREGARRRLRGLDDLEGPVFARLREVGDAGDERASERVLVLDRDADPPCPAHGGKSTTGLQEVQALLQNILLSPVCAFGKMLDGGPGRVPVRRTQGGLQWESRFLSSCRLRARSRCPRARRP